MCRGTLLPMTAQELLSSASDGEPIAILLVDDDPDCRMLVRDAIEEVKAMGKEGLGHPSSKPILAGAAVGAVAAAILPVVSYLGPAIVGVITGSVVIETVFTLPGVGASFIEGAMTRDYTRVMGAVILYGGLIIVLNLIADILYAILDPRVRYT